MTTTPATRLEAYELRLPALAIRQGGGRTLFSFAIDGKKLPLFAAVSRVKRDDQHRVGGYQRAESIAHINTIRRYLETTDAVLPNALVVAFDSRVRFESRGLPSEDGTEVGHLIVPVDESDGEQDKPAWIVDGQQRTAAIRDANVDRFPVYVTAFITESVTEQRSQFILVNSTKPLPKGLIHELLPVTPAADLPIPLLKRRYPAQLLERLNYDPDSPLRRRIRTQTTATGVIKDNSILKMLSMSIEDGALYQWFDGGSGTGDTEAMLTLLKRFWSAVASAFPNAWNAPPRRSRLVHGVGVIALGCLMDEMTYRLDGEIPTARQFERELGEIASQCAWTDGTWEFSATDRRRWNELQNTPRDIKTLSDFLVGKYRELNQPDQSKAA
jgi:DGQHR domain-containing protein